MGCLLLMRFVFFFLSLFLCCPHQCDAISTLEKEHDYRDEHLDFIQCHIRRFCLQCIFSIVGLFPTW